MLKIKQVISISVFLMAAILSIVDVGSDVGLAHQYYTNYLVAKTYNGTNEVYKNLHKDIFAFFISTGVWIVLGGLLQMTLVFVFFCKKHPSLEPFPQPAFILLCVSAPLLGASFVTNVFAAFLIFRNKDNLNADLIK